ncbi:MAG: hypothetical protein ACK53Y_21035, partial [bacterium]
IDTAVMNSVGVFGPLAATTVALNYSPELSLQICSALIFIGGAALSLSPQLKRWAPEKKTSKDLRLIEGVNLFLVPLPNLAYFSQN